MLGRNSKRIKINRKKFNLIIKKARILTDVELKEIRVTK